MESSNSLYLSKIEDTVLKIENLLAESLHKLSQNWALHCCENTLPTLLCSACISPIRYALIR
ncbi:hypothetical protein ANAPH2_00582 [Anaplasma phagocytophilum]|nr:hypothetical protein ANAPH2_00582 [Anaplasma phagocytophilum]